MVKPTKICDIRCKQSIYNLNPFSEDLNYKLNGFFSASYNGQMKIKKLSESGIDVSESSSCMSELP